jgi:hypothetical protein
MPQDPLVQVMSHEGLSQVTSLHAPPLQSNVHPYSLVQATGLTHEFGPLQS